MVRSNWQRFCKKISKDGLKESVKRIFQILWLRITRQNVRILDGRNHIPFHEVDSFNSETCIDLIRNIGHDILAIASAPILKSAVFKSARIGCLNAHPGWLPRYRGIGANAFALAQGHLPGVTLHWVDAGIDTGRIIVRETVPVTRRDSVSRINDRAVRRGAEMMAEAISDLPDKRVSPFIRYGKHGPVYRAMPYSEVKKVNRRLRSSAFINSLTTSGEGNAV